MNGRRKRYLLVGVVVLIVLGIIVGRILTGGGGEAPDRIVSLDPSTTEILFALGVGDKVLGVDNYSDYPEGELGHTVAVGGPEEGFSLSKIVGLRPDLVLAVEGKAPSDADIGVLAAGGTQVVVLSAASINDILDNIELIGQLTGKEKEAQELTTEMKERIGAVVAQTAMVSPKPSVFYEVSAADPDNPYTAGVGSFVHALIALAGGENIATGSGEYQIALAEIVAGNPEIIVLGDAELGESEDSVRARDGWQDISAVESRYIYPIDPDVVSRPGPRIVDGLEELAEMFHPDLFP